MKLTKRSKSVSPALIYYWDEEERFVQKLNAIVMRYLRARKRTSNMSPRSKMLNPKKSPRKMDVIVVAQGRTL